MGYDNMSLVRKVAKNTGLLIIASLFTSIMAFIWTLFTANYLGAEGFGILSGAIALTSMFGILADLGLGTYIIREVAREPKLTGKYFGTVSIIKLVLSAVTFISLMVVAFIKDYSLVSFQVLIYITLYTLLTSFTASLCNAIFQAHERMEFQTIGNIVNSALLLLAIIVSIYILKGDVVLISAGYMITAVFTLIYSLFVVFIKFDKPKFDFDFDFYKNTIKQALPFGVTAIFTTIYFWIDTVMLSFMQGDVSVGLYNASYKLLVVLISVYSVYMTAIFPMMSKFFINSHDALKFTYHRSIKYLLLLGIPMAVGGTVLAKEIILFIYSPEYLDSVFSLQILMWAVVFMYINGLTSNLLNSSNKQLTVTKITSIGAIFNVLINLIIIPVFGFIGASISTVLTEFLIFVIFTFQISKTQFSLEKDLFVIAFKLLFASLIMAITLQFIHLNIIITVIIGALVYGIFVLLFKVLDEKDFRILKELVNK